MSMKMLRKKAPRGGLIRWLLGDEETTINNVCGRKISDCREQYSLAEKVLREVHA